MASHLDSVHVAEQGPGGLILPASLAQYSRFFYHTYSPSDPGALLQFDFPTWSTFPPSVLTYLLIIPQPHFQESFSEAPGWSDFLFFTLITRATSPQNARLGL